MSTAPDRRIAIVVSTSSDIGTAMSRRWLSRGWTVAGTYRTRTPAVVDLEEAGAELVVCDLADPRSVVRAAVEIRSRVPRWDVLVMCPGTQEPVGPFADCDFEAWRKSIDVNFIAQMQFVQELLRSRRLGRGHGPCVLFFAGGGTNSAPVNYSAYTVSKIALIKMCELLDAELHDTRFAIVGPGWVKTKIHQETLRAGSRAGANHQRTIDNLAGDACTPLEKVLDCCDWLVDAPRNVMSGRNFSVVFDRWGRRELEEQLVGRGDMYKLRRSGNEW
jgi:NAD(P)-dependent dehydrogenase (short-subunit alcohol dehydrogenase family)